MDNEKFKEIKDRYTKFIEWDEHTLDDKLFRVASEYAFFQSLYTSTSRKKSQLLTELDSLHHGKWKYYKHNFDDALSQSDINKFIEKDLDVLKLRGTITNHEIYMRYFEECMKNLNQIRWDIKSFIEYKKFKAGLN